MNLKRLSPVRRSALLIGNSKWGGNYLSGVSVDIDNMRQFLLSPYGGAWNDSEISVCDEPIGSEVFLNELAKEVAESQYMFIYFSGHGELASADDPTYVLPGGEEIRYSDVRRECSGIPALFISDSCQGRPTYRDNEMLAESRKQFSITDSSLHIKARREFDEWLREMPAMITYASSVSPWECAADSSNGGLYSYELLKACRAIIASDDEESGVYGICYPHMMARRAVVAVSGGEQTPTISGYNRSYQPPFVVKI